MYSNYDGAISFAGEQRQLARTITRRLTALGYKLFYDDYNLRESFGKDMTENFQEIYGNVKNVIIIVSKEYLEKTWTKLERRYAIQNFYSNDNRTLQVKVDDVNLPGLPTQIGYYPYDGDIDKLLGHLCEILGKKEPMSIDGNSPLVQSIMESCFRRAIFTSMDSEIRTDSMFNSLRECISQLNQLLPKIRDGRISNFVKGIVKDLDNIDRYSVKGHSISYFFPEKDKKEINSLKLNIIDKLHYLNYQYNMLIDIPEDIGFEYELRNYRMKD